MLQIDLHGYHPTQVDEVLELLIQQAWEIGSNEITIIHGHGRARANPRPFANTNTGYLGLTVRNELRHSPTLRQWIKYTTMCCRHDGSTSVKLKRNPNPSRLNIDLSQIPEPLFNNALRW